MTAAGAAIGSTFASPGNASTVAVASALAMYCPTSGYLTPMAGALLRTVTEKPVRAACKAQRMRRIRTPGITKLAENSNASLCRTQAAEAAGRGQREVVLQCCSSVSSFHQHQPDYAPRAWLHLSACARMQVPDGCRHSALRAWRLTCCAVPAAGSVHSTFTPPGIAVGNVE
jgi:hypothetical protein